MVKEIITDPGRTFAEYCLLPDFTPDGCDIQSVSLESTLAGVQIKIPLWSAAMTSVTGREKVMAHGREGGLPILPARLQIDESVSIIGEAKDQDLQFVETPIKIKDYHTIEQALSMIEKHGHSKLPIIDENNVLQGMFTQQHYWQTNPDPQAKVTTAMLPFDQVPITRRKKMTVSIAKRLIGSKDSNYLVVLDDSDRVVKIAFKKDIDKIKVGAAISTHQGWQERVEAYVSAGVDMIVIDTSDAYNSFAEFAIKEYDRMRKNDELFKGLRDMGVKVPICGGNVVTYDAAMFLMKAGADLVKFGMSSGSICTTAREKATGRAPMKALIRGDQARKDYFKATGRYVPILIDGGLNTSADIIIALTMADAVMMGGYFNKFYEAAGEKLDENGKITNIESKMRYVATWGEGSERAQNYDRYSQTQRTFFAEGMEGTVPYAGRLKPSVQKDLLKIKAAMVNVGAMNLEEFRDKSRLEVLSLEASGIVSDTHDMKVK